MTDLKISKALALAIGWKDDCVCTFGYHSTPALDELKCWTGDYWRTFDYQDWAVVGPIAATYNCFPYRVTRPIEGGYTGKWNAIWQGGDNIAGTPQKAIALAVIQGAKT